MCRTGSFNLSYESLTSYEARQKLRDLKSSDPEFWAELARKTTPDHNTEITAAADDDNEDFVEDDENIDPLFEDDSDLPCNVVIASVLGQQPRHVTATANGDLVSTRVAEYIDNEELSVVKQKHETDLGHSKRKKITNKLYSSKSFWRHNDNEASDSENAI